MRLRSMVLPFLAFFSLAFLTSMASAGLDCTPICGNPTCCIASEVVVPTCILQGDEAKLSKSILGAAAGKDAAGLCVGQPTADRIPLIKPDGLNDLQRFSCNWGCCPGATAARFAAENIDVLRNSIRDQAVASNLQQFPAASRDGRLQSSIDEATAGDRLCIFCCTF